MSVMYVRDKDGKPIPVPSLVGPAGPQGENLIVTINQEIT